MITLSPIKFPELDKLKMAHKEQCRPEAWTSAMMILSEKSNQEYWYDPASMVIYIWEPLEGRMWILGFSTAIVCYFSFETGNPFCWYVESLLKKSRTESWDFSRTLFHVQSSINYPIPAGNDVLPEKDGLPTVLWEMEEKKVLGSGARKILRNYFCQLKFAPLGFPEPTRTRNEVLSVVISSTVNTTIEQVVKIHPQIYSMLMVEQEKEYAETKRLEEEIRTEEQEYNQKWLKSTQRTLAELETLTETRKEGTPVAENQGGTKEAVPESADCPL